VVGRQKKTVVQKHRVKALDGDYYYYYYHYHYANLKYTICQQQTKKSSGNDY